MYTGEELRTDMIQGNLALDLRRLEKDLYAGRNFAQTEGGLWVPQSGVTEVPDNLASLDEARRKRNDAYKSIGFMFGAEAQGKRKGMRAEYIEWLKQHPWVNEDEIWNLWKIPVYKVLETCIAGINKPAEERHGLVEDLFYGVLDAYQAKFGEDNRRLILTTALPRTRIELDFAKGASNIEMLYTIEHMGREMPVYVQKQSTADPQDAVLAERIKYILDNNKSYYNDSTIDIKLGRGEDKFGEFFNTKFRELAAPKLTRLDFGGSRFSENELLQIAYPRWLARQEAWAIQQYGAREPGKEKDIVVSSNTYHVNCYKKPNPLSLWWYWKKGDIIYDAIRSFLDPMLDGFQALGVPESALVPIVLGIYKRSISSTHRGFSNPRSPYLAWEV